MNASYLQEFLSDSARGATRNEIRELLKLLANPDIISLAGGLPAPDAFPIEPIVAGIPSWLASYGSMAFQYGPTEGDIGLKRQVIEMLVETEGPGFADLTMDHILITTASQQALDLCSRVFITPGDAVICGLPSYLGALGAFTACGARLGGIPLDDEGLRTDLLEQRLIALRHDGVHPKFIYTVPDFQNPMGVSLSLERRKELLEIAREFDLLVLEDNPYRQLRYVGNSSPCLSELDRDGRVISMFTFSKILFPGLRLGWVVGDPEVVARLAVAKQPVDLCTSGLSQLVAREFLKTGQLAQHLDRIREMYRHKRRAMLAALDEYLDPDWGVRWTRPEGGLFLWVELPRGIDASKLLLQAIEEEKVAFVSGGAFHCDGGGANTLRLNFSYPSIEKIEQAIERLARVIGKNVTELGPDPTDAARTTPTLVSGDHSLEQLGWNLALSEIVE